MRPIRGTCFLIIFVSFTIFMSIGMFFFYWLPIRKFAYLVRFWCYCTYISACFLLGIRYQVIGKENIPPEPYIVASNHQSMWETMAFFLIFKDVSVILKKELLNIPFIGWHLRKMGNIPVDRGTKSSIRVVEDGGVSVLDQGRPLLIFPEGTRNAGVNVKLKSGIFFIYQKRAIPVVPVVHNAGYYFKSFWKNRSGVIKIIINPAIPPYLSREILLQRIKESFDASNKILND